LQEKNWFTRHETDRFFNNHCQELHYLRNIWNCWTGYIITESVCFMSCEPIFFLQLFLCGTHGIYFYFFPSTEHCAWAIISPKEFKSWVTCISFALLYGKTELSVFLRVCSINMFVSRINPCIFVLISTGSYQYSDYRPIFSNCQDILKL
jgi:hypothetical protein